MVEFFLIDPVAIAIGPLQIHWYGLMYLFGFACAWFLAKKRANCDATRWNAQQVADLLFYGMLGVVLGGRVGYVLFYNWAKFLEEPLWLFKLWTGGMSFHGGLLGVILAAVYFSHKNQRNLWDIGDFIAPLVPLGLFFGRIGNFINGELWGRVSDVPWAVIFEPGGPARHPSQLYEAVLEGLLLFILLWWFSSSKRPRAAVSGLFLVGYGLSRFSVEFFREPDAHIGFDLFDWLTRGQLLSVPMIVAGLGILFWAYRMQARRTS